jgi:hypothetical protein
MGWGRKVPRGSTKVTGEDGKVKPPVGKCVECGLAKATEPTDATGYLLPKRKGYCKDCLERLIRNPSSEGRLSGRAAVPVDYLNGNHLKKSKER